MPLDINPSDKILIIAPHPDDECIGAGGLIALYSSQCTVIVVTDGGQADKTIPTSIMKTKRKKEFHEEMNAAGIKNFLMMDYRDGNISNSPDIFRNIDFKKYTKIFLPSQIDRHPDHTFCAIFSLKEMEKQEVSDIEVYYYEVHRPLSAPTEYIDITNVMNKKIEYIKIHESQCRIRDYGSQAKCLAQYRACQEKAVGKYYEVYEKIDFGSINIDCNEKHDSLISSYRWKNSVLQKWVKNKIYRKEIGEYLSKQGIKRVGIYGHGEIGQLLYDDFSNLDIGVAYFLDRRADYLRNKDIPVMYPDKYHGDVDAIIVTIPSDKVKEILIKQGYKMVLCLANIFDDMDTLDLN